MYELTRVVTEETMEDEMEAEIATVIVVLHGTHLTEVEMVGTENALLDILHTADIVVNAPGHRATHHTVVEKPDDALVTCISVPGFLRR